MTTGLEAPQRGRNDLADHVQARRHPGAHTGEHCVRRGSCLLPLVRPGLGKTKRLRNNPRVEIAPATLRGTPTGPAVAARATLLTGAQAQFAAQALGRRTALPQGVLVPFAHRIKHYQTMHYEIEGA